MGKIFLIIIFLFFISCETSDTSDEGPFADCPCETVRGYQIRVCEGQDWDEASFEALRLHEQDSNCN